jgi:hypothetical protein
MPENPRAALWNGAVTTARERDAATIPRNVAAVIPDTPAFRIGSFEVTCPGPARLFNNAYIRRLLSASNGRGLRHRPARCRDTRRRQGPEASTPARGDQRSRDAFEVLAKRFGPATYSGTVKPPSCATSGEARSNLAMPYQRLARLAWIGPPMRRRRTWLRRWLKASLPGPNEASVWLTLFQLESPDVRKLLRIREAEPREVRLRGSGAASDHKAGWQP